MHIFSVAVHAAASLPLSVPPSAPLSRPLSVPASGSAPPVPVPPVPPVPVPPVPEELVLVVVELLLDVDELLLDVDELLLDVDELLVVFIPPAPPAPPVLVVDALPPRPPVPEGMRLRSTDAMISQPIPAVASATAPRRTVAIPFALTERMTEYYDGAPESRAEIRRGGPLWTGELASAPSGGTFSRGRPSIPVRAANRP